MINISSIKSKKCYTSEKSIIFSWIFSILFVDILAENLITANILPDENGPLSEVQTAIGLEVSLPCDLIPVGSQIIQDKVSLVIWYKEGTAKPIYTFDARGKSLQQAIHWADPDVLKSKAHFYYDAQPPALRIKFVKRDDAGLYRCRVDFQKSPTRNWRINLTVLVPPTQLVVLDTQGATITENIIGPYREGTNINVTCLSSGGIPPPRVSWWKEHALLDDSFQVLPDGSVKNILHLYKLSRKDLFSVYTCQASNGHVVSPLSNTVKLDMRLPPLYVRLQGLNHPLVSGVRTQISCSTAGARPPPHIIWNKGGILMRGASQTISADGNVTASELILYPSPEDNGKTITCSVTADTIAGGAAMIFKDFRILDVKHSPIVSLALGAPLDPLNLMMGADVYLECDIKANPIAKRVEWFHNDKQLQSSRGIIIANQTLVLQGITKSTHGQYMCRATNLHGTVSSNEVYIDVKYPPVCVHESTVIKAAIKQTINITCKVDSNPMFNLTYKWAFNNSLENVIELPTFENITRNFNQLNDDTNTEPVYSNMIDQPSQNYNSHSKHSHQYEENKTSIPNNIYQYKVDSFQHFGTVRCNAHNSIGQSGPCLYHIMVAENPDPVNNCTSFNSTANSIQILCVPGRNGGIQQYFHVEVFDETARILFYNTTFSNSNFVLKKLPSDTCFEIRVVAYNLQGSSRPYLFRGKTLPAPLLKTASSTAVLVQLTPLLGALVGGAITLFLVAICIIIFIKFRTKSNGGVCSENNTNEADKGSAEPLSRNLGSHSSLDEKNPDVVPQENTDDEYLSEEKAFDRINADKHRIMYTPYFNTSTSQLSHPRITNKPLGELSLTTNPAFALYNSPQRRPPIYSSPPLITNSNIYTRIPARAFTPYDTRTSPVINKYGGVTMPLLLQSDGVDSKNS